MFIFFKHTTNTLQEPILVLVSVVGFVQLRLKKVFFAETVHFFVCVFVFMLFVFFSASTETPLPHPRPWVNHQYNCQHPPIPLALKNSHVPLPYPPY